MPTATNNLLFPNALLGYGYDAGQGQGAYGQQLPAQGLRTGLPQQPAVQAFGGVSGFQPAAAQGRCAGKGGAAGGGLGGGAQGAITGGGYGGNAGNAGNAGAAGTANNAA